MFRLLFVVLASAALFGTASAAQLTPCGAGNTNCSNDTVNQAGVENNAYLDSPTQDRVYRLAIQQCLNVYSEAISGAITLPIHQARSTFCGNIASGAVSKQSLIASIMNSTLTGELLAGSGPGGNMVDADINTAIDAMLTVSGGSTINTTGTAGANSQAVTVASATGINQGQSVSCAGCAAGTLVASAPNGTTVMLSIPTTAALSSTPMAFVNPLSGPAIGNY